MSLQEFRAQPEDDRDLMLAEHDLVCPSCGNLRELCSRYDVAWYPQQTFCGATAARQLVSRKFAALTKTDPSPDAQHPSDGVNLWVSDMDLTPDDDFLSPSSQRED